MKVLFYGGAFNPVTKAHVELANYVRKKLCFDAVLFVPTKDKYIKHDEDTRITLAKGLAMGLEFKLGSEILRTVVVREWKEISIVAGIILLRATLTFLIHWEIKQEEKDALEHKCEK